MLTLLILSSLWAQPLNEMCILDGSLRNTFGYVRSNRDGSTRAHQGWDLRAKPLTPVYAVADSRVMSYGYSKGYGNYISIKSKNSGYIYFYAHLHKFYDWLIDVKAGEVIGKTGMTGNASGLPLSKAHLHFELRTRINPGLGLTGRLSPRFGIGLSKETLTCDK